MRRLTWTLSLVPRLLVPLLAGLLALALSRSPSQAEQRTFLVAGMDGYGVNDCLATDTDCGRLVAHAWCSAHGLARVIAFGSAGDVTGSIGRAQAVPAHAMAVTCGD
jgi:hypothetical protein